LQPFADSANLHYGLGLLSIRQQDRSSALDCLQKAAEFAEQNGQYQYVYALTLHSMGGNRKCPGGNL